MGRKYSRFTGEHYTVVRARNEAKAKREAAEKEAEVAMEAELCELFKTGTVAQESIHPPGTNPPSMRELHNLFLK